MYIESPALRQHLGRREAAATVGPIGAVEVGVLTDAVSVEHGDRREVLAAGTAEIHRWAFRCGFRERLRAGRGVSVGHQFTRDARLHLEDGTRVDLSPEEAGEIYTELWNATGVSGSVSAAVKVLETQRMSRLRRAQLDGAESQLVRTLIARVRSR